MVIFHVLPTTYKRVVPPYLESFRVFSERSTVAEWKDGTQQYFKTDYSYVWWERINDLGKIDKEFYSNLTSEQFLKLCKKYGVSYVVFPAAKTLELPYIYENKEYRIYTCNDTEG